MPANAHSLRVTDAYRDRLIALTARVSRDAERNWPRIEDFDASRWPETMERTTTRAQVEATRLSAAYVTVFISSELGHRVPVITVDSAAFTGRTRGGEPIRKLLDNIFVGVRSDMAKGHSPDEALKRGLSRATRNIDLEVMESSRRALSALMEADERIEGWQRSVKGTCGACMGDIAVEVSVELPSVPLKVHPNCQCVTEPVVAPRSPREVLKDRAFNPLLRREPGRNFTPEDWDELTDTYHYFGTPRSYAINNYLRTGDDFNAFDMSVGEMNGIIKGMDTALEHAGPLGVPVRVYRGLGGTLRELGLPDSAGKMFTDKGFGSTSAERSLTDVFSGAGSGVRLDLTVDPRVKAVWGANPSEGELLLERGCRYIIRSIEKKGNQWHVEADVLSPK